jgi:hypothetical protein
MMLSTDTAFINALLNDPYVQAGAFPDGVDGDWYDVTPFIEAGSKFLRWADAGGFLLIPVHVDGSYCVHTMFHKGTAYSTVRHAVDAGFYKMFVELDATCIYTSSRNTNIPAERLCAYAGFKPMYTADKGSYTETYYSMPILEWVLANQVFQDSGKHFHELAADHTNHDEDAHHDRVVGAVMAMFRCGNASKGIDLYNKWAMITGYEPMIFDEEHNSLYVGTQTIVLTDDQTDILEVK